MNVGVGTGNDVASFERVKVSKTVQTPAVSLSLISFYANLRERNTYLRSFPV
jgi:hypothetical protein